MNRRGFVATLAAAFAAPAIIRPGILMPIKSGLVPAGAWTAYEGDVVVLPAGWCSDGGYLYTDGLIDVLRQQVPPLMKLKCLYDPR